MHALNNDTIPEFVKNIVYSTFLALKGIDTSKNLHIAM